MKNLRKLHVLAVALVMVLCMMATTLFVAASGTGDISDPIVFDTVESVPASVTVPAGATVFYTVPAGGLELTVVDLTTAVNVVGPKGNVLAYTSDNEGTATVVFDGYADGDTVLFGLWNQNPYADTVVTLSIGEPVPAEEGTEANPINANDKYFAGAFCYLLNPTLLEGDNDGVWYEFTAPSNGIMCVENSGSDYQLSVMQGYSQLNAYDDEVYSNPVMSYRLTAGETVRIWIIAEPDANRNYPETTVYASIYFVAGNEIDPVAIKSKESFKANIAAGDTVCFLDATNGGLWGGKGLVISGYSEAIEAMVVTVDGVEYTDVDRDGTIELTLPGDPNAMIALHPEFSITNGHEWDLPFTLTLVDEAHEDEPAVPELGYCSCGTELEYYERLEPCHQNGCEEYWYCPTCDAVYADEAATIVTNRMNLTIPADCELVYMPAVEACHANGSYEYWFCPECQAVFSDAEGRYLTNRMNLTIPADRELKHFDKVEPTATKDGMKEHYYCDGCDCYFVLENGNYINVARLSLIIPALGEPADETNPSTGDSIMTVVMLTVAAAMGLVVVTTQKKRFV